MGEDNNLARPKFFLHIPKNAGTTLRFLVYRNYKKDASWLYAPHFMPLLGIGNDKLSQIKPCRAIMGHFLYGLHNKAGFKGDYITWLRKPVEREVSVFSHYNRSKIPFHRQILNKYPDLISFSDNPLTGNQQTYFLSGISDRKYFNNNKAEALERAKKNLKKFFFVGFQESFDASLSELSNKLEWQDMDYIRLNQDKKKYFIDADTEQALKNNLKYDIELYDWAKKEFYPKDIASSIKLNKISIDALFDLIKFKIANKKYECKH